MLVVDTVKEIAFNLDMDPYRSLSSFAKDGLPIHFLLRAKYAMAVSGLEDKRMDRFAENGWRILCLQPGVSLPQCAMIDKGKSAKTFLFKYLGLKDTWNVWHRGLLLQ